MGDETLDMAGILAGLRKAVTRREETKAEGLERFANWWEAIHSELVNANREQWHGGPKYRLGTEDVDHAMRMHVWARYMADDETWQQHPDNRAALAAWRTVKAAAGNDDQAIKAAYSGQQDHVKERLSKRPKAPDRRDVAIQRPRNFLPSRWPEIAPGTPWSVYLSALLTEIRMRGCLRDEEAAQ